jgi:hypothetical protein
VVLNVKVGHLDLPHNPPSSFMQTLFDHGPSLWEPLAYLGPAQI